MMMTLPNSVVYTLSYAAIIVAIFIAKDIVFHVIIIMILNYVFVVLVVIEIILLSEANTWKDNLNNNVSIYFYPRGEYRENHSKN
jgi:hypothetical protein